MKRVLPGFAFSLWLIVFSLFFPLQVLAATLTLTAVGNFKTEGKTYNQIWYTNGNSYLAGTAAANASVAVTIDSTSATATATASGAWTHNFSLAAGDHNVTLTSGGETLSFILTIGSLPDGTTTPVSTDSGTLPDSGISTPTLSLLVFGGLLVLTPLVLKFKLNGQGASFKNGRRSGH